MGYAHDATTSPQVVHSLAELRMALENKARGQRIAQMRKRRRLTQQAMAEKLGVSYRAYQTWEAGKMPEWPNVEKLATFFRVKPEYIIGDTTPGPDEAPQLDRLERRLVELDEKVTQLLEIASQIRLATAAQQIADAADEQPTPKPKRRQAA